MMLRMAAVGAVTASMFVAPTAHADVLQCGYPATGYYVRADVAIVTGILYSCDYPREINGAHLHQEALTVNVNLNLGGVVPNIGGSGDNGSIGSNLVFGGQAWSSSWRCSDERYLAAQPNPVSAWNKPLRYGKCVALGVAPSAPGDTPWPAVDADVPFVWPPSLSPTSPPPTISPPVGDPTVAPDPAIPPASHGKTGG